MNINGIFSKQHKIDVTKSVKNNLENEQKSVAHPKNFDQIIIDVKPNNAADEKDFLAALKSKLNHEIDAQTDTKKLDEIKQKIKSGDYNINPEETARKMTIGI